MTYWRVLGRHKILGNRVSLLVPADSAQRAVELATEKKPLLTGLFSTGERTDAMQAIDQTIFEERIDLLSNMRGGVPDPDEECVDFLPEPAPWWGGGIDKFAALGSSPEERRLRATWLLQDGYMRQQLRRNRRASELPSHAVLRLRKHGLLNDDGEPSEAARWLAELLPMTSANPCEPIPWNLFEIIAAAAANLCPIGIGKRRAIWCNLVRPASAPDVPVRPGSFWPTLRLPDVHRLVQHQFLRELDAQSSFAAFPVLVGLTETGMLRLPPELRPAPELV